MEFRAKSTPKDDLSSEELKAHEEKQMDKIMSKRELNILTRMYMVTIMAHSGDEGVSFQNMLGHATKDFK
jgi:hypothetical protein